MLKPGVVQVANAGSDDLVVTKVAADGKTLVYSTYLGGAGADLAQGLALDGNKELYLAGSTFSANFPVTPGAYQATLNGTQDAFLAKLNATGTALVYATYIGGAAESTNYGGETAYGVTFDAAGNAFLIGQASSSTFPTTNGAYRRTYRNYESFLAKFNPTGTSLLYSTFITDCDSNDWAEAVRVDPAGNAYVIGVTTGYGGTLPPTHFAALPVGAQAVGSAAAYLYKIDPTGSNAVYGGIVDSSTYDFPRGLAIDAAGNAFFSVGGASGVASITPGAYQTVAGGPAGTRESVVTKVNAAGNAIVYSTYLGGSKTEFPGELVLDPSNDGSIWMTGWTESTDFPVTADAFQSGLQGTRDAYEAHLSADGSALLYSSYFGGCGVEDGGGLVVRGKAHYLFGQTSSDDLPISAGAFQQVRTGVAGKTNLFVRSQRFEACAVDADCSYKNSTKPVCDAASGKCVECNTSAQCSGQRSVCSASHACVACDGNAGSGTAAACPASAPACVKSGAALGACTTCLVDKDCKGTTPFCTVGSITTPAAATCGIAQWKASFGSTQASTCGACGTDAQCAALNPAAPLCTASGTFAGGCAQCTAANMTACNTAAAPACNTSNGTCDKCNGDNGSGATAACPTAALPACGADGTCGACSATNLKNCTGTTPTCDTATRTCAGCNGDNASGATQACPTTANPFCKADKSCGKCTANADCANDPMGALCNLSSGACGMQCTVDNDCPKTGNGFFCDNPTSATGAGICSPKLPNGTGMPNSNPFNSTCTASGGTRACISSACDTRDNKCGYDIGQGPCTAANAATVCRSAACGSNSGVCVPPVNGCYKDADCGSTSWCEAASHTCKPKLPNGTAMPTDPKHDPSLDGTCRTETAEQAAAVCVSGFCDPTDDKCGMANTRGPCTAANGATACRSGVCGSNLRCGDVDGTACSSAATCQSGECNSAHTCGPLAPEPTPETGTLEGGACSTTPGAGGSFAALFAAVGLLVAARRRRSA